MTNTRNAPIEVLENTYPFLIEEYALIEDSEGAGHQRGGMGIRRDMEVRMQEAKLTLSSDREEIPPWGVDGGLDASTSTFRVIRPDGEETEFPSKFSTRIEDEGMRIITETPGGGGWGKPTERGPEAVCKDVQLGLISRERAREVYGVAITPDIRIDRHATEDLR